MVVDCFVLCTYGSWSEQFGCCCEKNGVVANALLCYLHSHVSSVLKQFSFLSVDLNFHLFSVPLSVPLFLFLQSSERVENYQGLLSKTCQRC